MKAPSNTCGEPRLSETEAGRSTPRTLRLLEPFSVFSLQLTVRLGSAGREFYANQIEIVVGSRIQNPTGLIHGRQTIGAFPFPNRLENLSGSFSVGLDIVAGADDLLLVSASDSLNAGVESREANKGSCPISCSGLLFKSDDKEAGVGGGPISV